MGYQPGSGKAHISNADKVETIYKILRKILTLIALMVTVILDI